MDSDNRFLALKFEVPTLNTIRLFLHACDFKKKKKNFAEVNNNFKLSDC
jgi:hypothetical protein